jgi:DNA-binding transcriptional regulator GbsR (MarR family)
MLELNRIRKIMGYQTKTAKPKPLIKKKIKLLVSAEVVSVVLSHITAETAICREDLVKVTQFHACTISRATRELLAAGIVKKELIGGRGKRAFFTLKGDES